MVHDEGFVSTFLSTLGVFGVLVALAAALVFFVVTWLTVAKIWRWLRSLPWSTHLGALTITMLPFAVFTAVGLKWQAMVGIVAAGATIGTFCALFAGWWFRPQGRHKAIRTALLTMAIGTLGPIIVMALLIAGAQD